jgi:hypothetical protein
MANCAVIKDGKVINVVVAELTATPPDGCTFEEMPIGAIWDGNEVILYKENQDVQEIQVSGSGAIDGN